MTASIHISLQPGERIFVNGAVLRVDRKVTLEFLNDVTFLLENHVMQKEQATTPLRQLYFILQAVLMDPANKVQTLSLFKIMHAALLQTVEDRTVLSELKFIDGIVSGGKVFEALKRLRALFASEATELPVAVMANVRAKEMAACK